MRQSFNILLLCVVKWASELFTLQQLDQINFKSMPNLNEISHNTNRSLTQEQLISLSNQAERQGNPLPEYLRQLILEVKLKREQREKKIEFKKIQASKVLKTSKFLIIISMVIGRLYMALAFSSFILLPIMFFSYIEIETCFLYLGCEVIAIQIIFPINQCVIKNKYRALIQLNKIINEMGLLQSQGLNNRYSIRKRAQGREVRILQMQR